MSRISARSLLGYAQRCLRLKPYLDDPGDGRRRPRIAAPALLWAMVMGVVLRESSYHAVQWWVRSKARRRLGVSCAFSNDTLGYFTERLDPQPTRLALTRVCRRAKRNKAFDHCRYIGLALDGSTAGRCRQPACALCHPIYNDAKEIQCYLHHFVMASVVGTGLVLPVDVEAYPAGDSEYEAGQRLLVRAVAHLGRRFADYVVVDAKFATAPFLHTAGAQGMRVVARLKANLPELSKAAQQRFGAEPAHRRFRYEADEVEVWDADDFDPWERLAWQTVRVLRYRQRKRDGTVVDAYWLTDFTTRQAGSEALFRMAKCRWEIENQGFNDAKNRYGLAHIAHHEANSLLIQWLVMMLAMAIERLYRLRYLHRGHHPTLTAVELVRLLRLSLGVPYPDTS